VGGKEGWKGKFHRKGRVRREKDTYHLSDGKSVGVETRYLEDNIIPLGGKI
jgi:hypothetical protein